MLVYNSVKSRRAHNHHHRNPLRSRKPDPPPFDDRAGSGYPAAEPASKPASKPASNLGRFLDSTTPSVPAHDLPKMKMRGWRSCDVEYRPYFSLGNLWESFKEWSAYGAGVPLLLDDGSDCVVQYYVPYLSGLQLYGHSCLPALCLGQCGKESDGDSYMDSSSDGSSDSEPVRGLKSKAWSRSRLSTTSMLRMERLSLSENPAHLQEEFSSDDGEDGNSEGCLLFEYLEQDPPHCREPLADKISDLADCFPELKILRSCDLLPASWISVAWYPIYRIPTGPTLKDLDACFLSFHSLSTPTKAEKNHAKTIAIAASVGGTAVLVATCCFVLCSFSRMSWKKNINNDQNVENFLKKHGSLAPKRYKYSDVKKITESFRNKLGQGGYGSVFKGNLSDGRLVAVKVLSDSRGNGEDFFNEIASIGRSSHVNIVNMLGFCSEGSKRALIYEYMCNGSLDKLISSEKPKTTLSWQKLYQISIGIARGLEYLHRGSNTRIVHFDIKPHNILLDEDFCPKISDFGLSKLCLRKDSILSVEGTRGTVGYIAPEVFSRNFGVVSSKSDIYSYGMMVLEMAGGRENISLEVQNTSETYFPFSIYKHLDQIEGLQAYGATAETEELARKMILVGLWCIQTIPQNRPSITKVIEMLEGSIDDLQVPPKPYLSSFPSLKGQMDDISYIHSSCSNGGCSYAVH